QQMRARIYESGLVFSRKNKKIEQSVKVACLICGEQLPEQWGSKSRQADFFDLKGDAELLLGLGHDLAQFSFRAEKHPSLQPGQTARIYRADQPAGRIGALHPLLLQGLEVTGKVYLLELDYELISSASIPAVAELSRFPAVRRDLAIVIDEDTSAAAVQAVLRDTAGEDLVDMHLFDVFHGGNISA